MVKGCLSKNLRICPSRIIAPFEVIGSFFGFFCYDEKPFSSRSKKVSLLKHFTSLQNQPELFDGEKEVSDRNNIQRLEHGQKLEVNQVPLEKFWSVNEFLQMR